MLVPLPFQVRLHQNASLACDRAADTDLDRTVWHTGTPDDVDAAVRTLASDVIRKRLRDLLRRTNTDRVFDLCEIEIEIEIIRETDRELSAQQARVFAQVIAVGFRFHDFTVKTKNRGIIV